MLRLPTALRFECASPLLFCFSILPHLRLPRNEQTSEKLFASFQLPMQSQVYVSPAQGGIVKGWRGKASSESEGLSLTAFANNSFSFRRVYGWSVEISGSSVSS